MGKKKNPHVGISLDEFLARERARDPEFRARYDQLVARRKKMSDHGRSEMEELNSGEHKHEPAVPIADDDGNILEVLLVWSGRSTEQDAGP